MRKKILFLYLLILLTNPGSLAQNYFDNYEGIPLISFDWSGYYDQYDYQNMRKVSNAALSEFDQTLVKYTAYKNAGLKIIPYQGHLTTPNREITFFSEGSYIIWDAANSKYSNNEEAMKFSDDLAQKVNDASLNKEVIKANHTGEGKLVYGPDYFQQKNYLLGNQGIIQYTRLDSLKITVRDGYTPPSILTDETVVCELKVVYRTGENTYTVVQSDEVKVKDFQTYNNWLANSFEYNYNNVSSENTIYKPARSPENIGRQFVPHIEFWVIWKNVEYLDLWVNSVTIFDNIGWGLHWNSIEQNIIRDIAQNEGDYEIFPTSNYDTTVVSWYAVDEPESIDNLAVIQKIDDLINSASNGKRRLMMAMCNNWNSLFGEYGGTGIERVFKIDEYLSRTNLKLFQLTAYLYNYPYDPPQANYISDNILLYVYGLRRLSQKNKEFILGLQTGRWQTNSETGTQGVDKIPMREQFLYNMNIGLIFGAKGFSLNNYFAWNDKVTGLCTIEDDKITHEPLHGFVEETIMPRLSGLMGKTLRKLNQEEQETEINLRNSNYSDNYIDSIKTNGVGNDTVEVDIGLFSDSSNSDKKYLMLLSRWYNTNSADRYTFLFKTYRNWVIYDYIDSLSRGSLINSNNKGYIEDTISTGDARLYRIYPVVKYGGEINHDETVTSETLTENDLTINSGKTLTVMGTYDCYKNIIVNSGGKLDIKPGSTLNFHNGSKIVVNGLFTANGKSDSLINIDFQSVSGNPVNGITLGNNSSGNIDNCPE